MTFGIFVFAISRAKLQKLGRKAKYNEYYLAVREIVRIFATEFSLLHHLNFNHYGKRHQKDKERKDDGKG